MIARCVCAICSMRADLANALSADIDRILLGPRYTGVEHEVTFAWQRPKPGTLHTEPHPTSSVRLITRYVKVPL